MNNSLLSGNIQEKIQWYIKAHGHSSIGSLNLLWAYFSFQNDKNLAEIIQKSIDEFENFSEAKDVERQLENLKKDVTLIENNLSSVQIDKEKKNEMQDMILGVYENIERIESIIQNPGYEESFSLQNILESSITELIKRYPHTLYGDLIGKKTQETIKVEFKQKGTPKTLSLCGYEMQLLFYNILSNAIDAIQERNKTGSINILFDYKIECVHIEISNDGKQIPKTLLKKINNKKLFSTKGKHHGNGMRIIYDISEKYHVDIQVKSDSNNTKFLLDIPYKQH